MPAQSLALKKIDPNEVLTRIQKEAPKNALYIFDCDGTLIKGDIASLSAWSLIRLNLVNPDLLPAEWEEFKKVPFDYLAFKKLRNVIVEKRGKDAIYEWEAFLHAGLPPATSLDVARFAVQEGLGCGVLNFTKYVARLAKDMADQSWIVSGSPDVCVWAIAETLGIPPQRVLGTKLETVDGIYTAKVHEPGIIWEELKRTILHQHSVFQPYFVAGDTIGDWAMMQMATDWCWALVWGPHRHRGDEFHDHIQNEVLGTNATLPRDPGFYLFEGPNKKWVIEVRGKDSE
jgi:phosphoserine phosphatase